MASQKFVHLLIVASMIAVSTAFNPTVVTTMKPITRTTFICANKITSLKMSEAPEEPKTEASADGTVFDDEVPEYKPAISESMKARLLAEASSGLDADKPQTNVILYISIAVAILVALGGQGILF